MSRDVSAHRLEGGPDEARAPLRALPGTHAPTPGLDFEHIASLHEQLARAYRNGLAVGPETSVMEPVETTPTTLLRDIAPDYLDDLKNRVCKRHFKGVKARLGKILNALGDVTVEELKPLAVVKFRNELLAGGSSERTCDTYTQPLSSMLNWAVEMGIADKNPIARLKRLATKSTTPRYCRRALTEDEIARFLRCSRRDDADNEAHFPTPRVPQTPMWRFLIETGARYGEMRQVTWANLDLEKRVVVLRAETTKSKKRREIPILEELAIQLAELKLAHEDVLGRQPQPHAPLFRSPEGYPWGELTTNAGRILHRLLYRAGIPRETEEGRIDIHALRHTFGSRLARSGASLVKTQRLMGHSDPALTESVYTHLGVEDLRGAVGAPPEIREAAS